MTIKKPLMFLVSLAMALTINLRQAKAQNFAEVQTKVTHPHQGLTFLANLSGQFDRQWGLNVFLLMTSGYAETYAGPTITLDSGRLVLNASFGGEQSAEGFMPRYAGSIWMARGKVVFLGIIEANNGVFKGDDAGLFYDLSLKLKLGKFVAIGLKDKRPSGLGPMIQGKVGNLTVWVAWVPLTSESLKLQPDKALMGLRFGF